MKNILLTLFLGLLMFSGCASKVSSLAKDVPSKEVPDNETIIKVDSLGLSAGEIKKLIAFEVKENYFPLPVIHSAERYGGYTFYPNSNELKFSNWVYLEHKYVIDYFKNNLNNIITKYNLLKQEMKQIKAPTDYISMIKLSSNLNISNHHKNKILKSSTVGIAPDVLIDDFSVYEYLRTNRGNKSIEDYMNENVYHYVHNKEYFQVVIRLSEHNKNIFRFNYQDFKNKLFLIDFSKEKINLFPYGLKLSNKDIDIDTYSSKNITFTNKTNKHINIKKVSLYQGQDIITINTNIIVAPYGTLKSTDLSFENKMQGRFDKTISFGYALEYEIEGKRLTFLQLEDVNIEKVIKLEKNDKK